MQPNYIRQNKPTKYFMVYHNVHSLQLADCVHFLTVYDSVSKIVFLGTLILKITNPCDPSQ